MPYIRNAVLKNILRDAFMSGVITGWATDHDSPDGVSIEIFRDNEFEKYYKEKKIELGAM
ncbi:hypothetical protein [Paenibacillus sinopodophylli]|uniref:hypothetical protein n=1 Tax=Paenibacillus sinopodophylli TaxID=1837342 RepID=UPI00110CAE89|nr:hypothetical protein [Paenibacillus sinopodophylli]